MNNMKNSTIEMLCNSIRMLTLRDLLLAIRIIVLSVFYRSMDSNQIIKTGLDNNHYYQQ